MAEVLDEVTKLAEAMKTAEKQVDNPAPGGYIVIELSSKGKLGAPKLFHIRNLTTEEYMQLQQLDGTERLLKVADLLQACIWEKDVDIKKFHEQEVVETLIEMYRVFISDTLVGLSWQLTQEDIDHIKANDKHPAERLAAYENGEWRPVFDLKLSKLRFHVLDDSFKSNIRYTKGDFSCEFSFPRYGDALVLKQFIETYFKEQDKRFERNAAVLKRINDAQEAWNNGNTNIDISRLPTIPKQEMDELKEYQIHKAAVATAATKAMYVTEINGRDISELPLSEKLKIINEEPRIDHNVFTEVQRRFDEMEICTNRNVKAYDPVLRREVETPFRFYVAAILACLSSARPSDGCFTAV